MRAEAKRLAAAVVFLTSAAWGPAHAADAPSRAFDCAYAPRGVDDTATFRDCATFDAAGRMRVRARHLRRLRFDRHGLASLWVGSGFYYVTRTGLAAPVMAMDNGADDFTDGRARSPRGDKVGYIDRRLQLVIPARYDGALPFQHGRATVCVGCRLEADASGEHHDYVGGRWGCIDVAGREVVPIDRTSFAEAGC